VVCVLRHADGSTETLRLNHSFGTSQLDWFRCGSALNVLPQAELSRSLGSAQLAESLPNGSNARQ
jgi:hypothetical protein